MATVTGTDIRVRIAEDFGTMFIGKVPESALAATMESIATMPKAETAYPANGAIASILFWLHCRCNIDGGKIFEGDAFGLAVPGGSALFGDVYTDNLARLYSQTKAFSAARGSRSGATRGS